MTNFYHHQKGRDCKFKIDFDDAITTTNQASVAKSLETHRQISYEDLDLRALIVSECLIPNASKLIGSFIKMSKMIFIKLHFQLVV